MRKLVQKFLYRNGHKNNSPRWAFMEGFHVPDIDNPSKTYLWRLRIVGTPWFSIFVHKIMLPDNRPVLHDHPWNFFSVVIKGGYMEFVPGPFYATSKVVKRFNKKTVKQATHSSRYVDDAGWDVEKSLHWIAVLDRVPTWTLVFAGRRKRTWGYYDQENIWTPFNKHEFNDKFQAALETRGGGDGAM